MTVLRNGQWRAPFWGAEKTFVTGQDMLGMQSTSIATYGVLVPGLTNLTRRIRYYGFYTWILEQYAKSVGKVSVTEFRNYIRRAELIMAYLMASQFPETTGAVGRQFAGDNLNRYPTELDIAMGADREEGKKTYWKYSSGAFGQYYQGTLVALRLIAPIEANPQIFAATPNIGRELCACFEASISEIYREVFLDAIRKGKITRKNLKMISDEFCLTNIPSDSKEQSFYRMMILGPDFSEETEGPHYCFFRKDTVLLYLSFLKDENRFSDDITFWNTFYTSVWEGHPFENSTSANGWLYYCINEITHYCLETFLWHLLLRLEDQSLYLQNALELLTAEVTDELNRLSSFNNVAQFSFKELARAVYAEGDEPFEDIKSIEKDGRENPAKAAATALISLAKMHIHIGEQLRDITEYSRYYRMDREGDSLSLFVWMARHYDLPVGEFLEKLYLQKIINRHLEVAMRKMRNRNENTLKFIFEDNQLKHVLTYLPVFTTPRIPSLHYILEDIGFLEQDSQQLTPDGTAVIEGGISG